MSITIGAKRRWLFDLSFIPLIESIVVVVVPRWLPALQREIQSRHGTAKEGEREGETHILWKIVDKLLLIFTAFFAHGFLAL